MSLVSRCSPEFEPVSRPESDRFFRDPHPVARRSRKRSSIPEDGLRIHAERAEFRLSVQDPDRLSFRGTFILSPEAAERPEAAEIAGDDRMESDLSVHHIVTEAAVCLKHCEGGHAAGVVASAFDFIPRISFPAVVAVADCLCEAFAFSGFSGHDQVGGGGPFETGHGFGVVGQRDHRFFPAGGPGADPAAALVVDGEGAPGVREIAHGGGKVVLEDGVEGRVHPVRIEEIADSVE